MTLLVANTNHNGQAKQRAHQDQLEAVNLYTCTVYLSLTSQDQKIQLSTTLGDI